MPGGSVGSSCCHTWPVLSSIACPTTDRACTSNPTNVRCLLTEASHNCWHYRYGLSLRQPTSICERGLSPSSYRLRSHWFHAVCTGCNLCRPHASYVNVGFRTRALDRS